ncbi:MAG: hypothetical protein RJB01_1597 [Actinomycetota bacterium]
MLGVTVVPEYLRSWVGEHAHPPLHADQYAIWQAQRTAERERALSGSIVSDPAALMTGVYSHVYFDDPALLEMATDDLPWYSLLVWCDLDLEWAPDGAQRDGPEFRRAAHRTIEEFVIPEVEGVGLPWIMASGSIDERVEAVLAELRRGTPL